MRRGQVGRRARLIEKDELGRIERRDLAPPGGARRLVLLAGDQRLFLRGRPRSRSQRLIVESEGRMAKAVSNQPQSWAKVASGWAATRVTSAIVRSGVRPLGRPERGRDKPEPVRRR
jgi:hypothetical protein